MIGSTAQVRSVGREMVQISAAITSPPPATRSGGADEWVLAIRALDTRGPTICPTPYAAVIAAIMLKRTPVAILFAAGMAMVTAPTNVPPTRTALTRKAGP